MSDVIIWNEENISFQQLQQQVHIIRYEIYINVYMV